MCAAPVDPLTVAELVPPGSFIANLSGPGVFASDRDGDSLSFSFLFGNEEAVRGWSGALSSPCNCRAWRDCICPLQVPRPPPRLRVPPRCGCVVLAVTRCSTCRPTAT